MQEEGREHVECALCHLPAVVEDADGVGYCTAHYARLYRLRTHFTKLRAVAGGGVARPSPVSGRMLIRFRIARR